MNKMTCFIPNIATSPEMNDGRHLNVMVVRRVMDSQMRLIVLKECFFFLSWKTKDGEVASSSGFHFVSVQ